jgi:O-antigen ligase
MSTREFVARRSFPSLSGQALMIGAAGVAASVWIASAGLQSRHAFIHEAVPILLVPLALWLFFSERYEVTLAVLLLYLGLLDGVVKLASGSTVATLGRDLLLYAITFGALVRMTLRRTPLTLPPFTGIVLAWVAVCVMQVANPADVSIAHAVASLRQHLEFVPLFFFGYFVLRSEQRVTGLLVLLLIIGAANGLADLLQTRLTPDQLATWGPGYARLENGSALTGVARVFYAGGQARVRPPGLGGEDGFGGLVGLIALPGAIALLSSGWRTAKLGWLLIPATGLTIVGIVTSQTKLALLGSILSVFVFLALTLTSRRGLTALLLTAVVGVAGYFIVSSFVSSSANRYSGIAPSKVLHTVATSRQSSLATIPAYIVDYPLGAGLGSVGPATSAFGGSAAAKLLNGETEFTFLLVETGIPGLVIMLAFVIATLRAGLALRLVVDPGLQRCLMGLTAVLILLFVSWTIEAVTSDSPTSPFLWLAGGCLAYWYDEARSGRISLRPGLMRRVVSSR